MTAPPTKNFQSASEQDTIRLAERVAAMLRGGDYVSLEGDLGAGKTLFARAMARAMGVNEPVTSPTFVIQKIYTLARADIKQLVHYDFYRISHYHELVDLGFEDHTGETVVLAEWGNLFIDDFPVKPIRIRFEIGPNDSRLIEIKNLTV